MGLGEVIFEKPPNVCLSQMFPEKQNTLGIVLSQRSSRELLKSFDFFKSSLSSETQVLKVGSFSKIPGSDPGFIPDRGWDLTKCDKMKKSVHQRSRRWKGVRTNFAKPEPITLHPMAIIQFFFENFPRNTEILLCIAWVEISKLVDFQHDQETLSRISRSRQGHGFCRNDRILRLSQSSFNGQWPFGDFWDIQIYDVIIF